MEVEVEVEMEMEVGVEVGGKAVAVVPVHCGNDWSASRTGKNWQEILQNKIIFFKKISLEFTIQFSCFFVVDYVRN